MLGEWLMATILRSLHVAILVSDLETARGFYRDILGLEESPRSLNFPGYWFQIGEFQLHLMQCDDWRAPCPRPDKWGRNPHLALQIDDLATLKARLTEQGYPIQMSASGRAALFTQDPDGNIVEIGQA
jgi:catechol 2,3-dioxygenase-like lactoylglutathione lyase family enzyme